MPRSERLMVQAHGHQLAGERWQGRRAGPLVIMLHPSVADRRCWRDVAAQLADDVTVVAYDRRGFGDTPPPVSRFSHLDDLATVLEAVADSPVWLVGSSAGGRLALDIALTQRARVAGLVLLAPAVTGAPPPALDPATERLDRLRDSAAAQGDLEEVNRLDLWLWLDGPEQPEGRVGGPVRELAQEMNATVLRNSTPGLVDAQDTGTWARLAEIDVPTTVISGDLDVPSLHRRSIEVARRLPQAEHCTIGGVAHEPFLERPSAVADLIARALGNARRP